jgi:Fe2+ or Zn2+ uptake regulation protein
MSDIAVVSDYLGGFAPRGAVKRVRYAKSRAPWPVWKGASEARELPSRPITKREALEIWSQANQLEDVTRKPGKREGRIGRSALLVLNVMLFKRHHWKTGRLDPSYDTLARDAHMCRSTVYRALNKLRAVGIIERIRRCYRDTKDDGSFCLRQDTNQYHFNLPSLWKSFKALWSPVKIDRDDLGLEPFIPDLSGMYAGSEAIKAGAKGVAVLAYLSSDPNDRLGQQVAGLGAARLGLPRKADLSHSTAERAREVVYSGPVSARMGTNSEELKDTLARRLGLVRSTNFLRKS